MEIGELESIDKRWRTTEAGKGVLVKMKKALKEDKGERFNPRIAKEGNEMDLSLHAIFALCVIVNIPFIIRGGVRSIANWIAIVVVIFFWVKATRLY